MVSQWNSSGIFSRIHHIGARPRSPKVPVKNEQTDPEFLEERGQKDLVNEFTDLDNQ